jgi:2-haloacid dehalogenase/putative hydrolase of the HAD superfamily
VGALSFSCSVLLDVDAGQQAALEEEGLLGLLPEPWEGFRARLRRRVAHWQATTYRHYREVLALSLQESLAEVEVKIDDRTALQFADSTPDWPIHAETVSSLRRLGSHWPMILISNFDRAPVRVLVERLGIPFAEVVTGEDVRAYKPGTGHFVEAQRRLAELASRHWHVADDLATDIEPTLHSGISAVWINRKGDLVPDGVEPTLVVKDLIQLCKKLGV